MEDLLKTALAGTSRAQTQSAGAIDPADALALAVEGTPDQSFLLRAGTAAAYRMAGYVPPVLDPLEPASPDDAPACPPRIAEVLRGMFNGEGKEFLPELLDRMQRAGLRIPHESLPAALSIGDEGPREAIGPVLGPRGEWLARLNPDWSWAEAARRVPDDADVDALRARWDEGDLDTRRAALRRLRAMRPADAHDWLREALPVEKAERRAQLIETLKTGLSRDDEPFLESLLDDRSEVVRATAGTLLAQIPESAYRARMVARADAILSAERGAWPRRKLKLVCDPPESVGKDWTRDGLLAKPPPGVGKRAWWTTQVLSVVDLGHWESRLGASPEELLAAAQATDYADDILNGWLRSAGVHLPLPAPSGERARAWAPLLWEAGTKEKMRKNRYEPASTYRLACALLPVLPGEDAGRLVLGYLEKNKWRDSGSFHDVVASLPRPWDAEFSHAYLKQMRRILTNVELAWVMTLPLAQAAIPHECLGEALKLAEEGHGQFEGYMQNRMLEFLNAIRIRKTIVEEIPL